MHDAAKNNTTHVHTVVTTVHICIDFLSYYIVLLVLNTRVDWTDNNHADWFNLYI